MSLATRLSKIEAALGNLRIPPDPAQLREGMGTLLLQALAAESSGAWIPARFPSSESLSPTFRGLLGMFANREALPMPTDCPTAGDVMVRLYGATEAEHRRFVARVAEGCDRLSLELAFDLEHFSHQTAGPTGRKDR